MKSLTEIIGGGQLFLGMKYDLQDCFDGVLSDSHRVFIGLLSKVAPYFNLLKIRRSHYGRKGYSADCFLRAFLAKSYFKLESVRDLIERLQSDRNLKQICGFTRIPSEATFSRRLSDLSVQNIMEQILNRTVTDFHANRMVGHISRDSTAIVAREKPQNKKKEIKPEKRRKRGRPKKGEIVLTKKQRRMNRQFKQKAGKSLKELNKNCAWGCKRNSQGNKQFWKGYKLHLDVTDYGIPISAVVTGANVHDSQTAIPMEKMTEKKITHLYSVMDAAYDASEIRTYIQCRGRIDLIDFNSRNKQTRREMTTAEKERFKSRSVVERANAHLKDWLIPQKIFVKGFRKVRFALLTGVLCLATLKILQWSG